MSLLTISNVIGFRFKVFPRSEVVLLRSPRTLGALVVHNVLIEILNFLFRCGQMVIFHHNRSIFNKITDLELKQ